MYDYIITKNFSFIYITGLFICQSLTDYIQHVLINSVTITNTDCIKNCKIFKYCSFSSSNQLLLINSKSITSRYLTIT